MSCGAPNHFPIVNFFYFYKKGDQRVACVVSELEAGFHFFSQRPNLCFSLTGRKQGTRKSNKLDRIKFQTQKQNKEKVNLGKVEKVTRFHNGDWTLHGVVEEV